MALNWHGQENDDETPSTFTPELEVLDELPRTSSIFPESNSLVILARNRLVEQDVNYKIVEAASRALTPKPLHVPNRAFLGRLRGLIRAASSAQDISAFITDCADKPAGKDLRRCRLGRRSLSEWMLQDVFSRPEIFFIQIGYPQGTSLAGLSGSCFRNFQPDQLPEAEDMLWSYQKRYADLVIQGLVQISKRRDS